MQQDLETTLANLVAIASISSNADGCHEAIDFVKRELEALDLIIHHQKNTPHPWLVATTMDTKEPEILLAAHLDVVPAPNEMFFMKKEDDKLYGRGVYDMKLAAACYLELFKNNLSELKKRNVGILFTTDEEVAGDSPQEVLDAGWRPKVVFLPDGGDNWQIEKRAKGRLAVELQAFGKSAHGSRPWEGTNAIHVLEDALKVLRGHYPSKKPEDPTFAVTVFQGGEVFNQIPDYAAAQFDFRAFENEEIEGLRDVLETLKTSHNITLGPEVYIPPVLFNATAPGVDLFLESLKEKIGKEKIGFCESYGASDARFFVPYDIPCIVMEPLGGGRHSANEWLDANDFGKYYELIKDWVLKLPEHSGYTKSNELLDKQS